MRLKTFENFGKRIISTPSDFNDFVREVEEELDARCVINKSQCMNDKVSELYKIMKEEGVELDTESWGDDSEIFDSIVDGTWEYNQ